MCAAYHLPLREAMRLTMPQIIMMNHAAWAEHKNAELRYEAKKRHEEHQEETDPVIPEYGMRLSELQENPALYELYLSDWSNFG